MNYTHAVAKLDAISAVRPDISPVVDVALEVVKGAQDAIAKAETRARVAEETLADVTPEIKKIAIRAAVAEEEVRLRDQLDKNQQDRDAVAKREKVAKAERVDLARAAAEMVEKFAKARGELIEKIVTAHRQVEPSLIENRSAYGPFVVKHVDGSVFRVAETRAEALQAVDELLAYEKKLDVGSDELDDEDSEGGPRVRREPQPGENAPPEDIVPGHAGRLDGARLKKTKIRKHGRLL